MAKPFNPPHAAKVEELSLSAKAKLRAAEALRKGTVGANTDAPITVHVRPGTFKGTDGKVVTGVRVGKHFLVPEHIDAICEALGVTPDEDRYFALFE